jgi:hypothetical protein
MRSPRDRNHAHRCVPVLLRLQTLRRDSEAQVGRLLRVLLLRGRKVSADSGERETVLFSLINQAALLRDAKVLQRGQARNSLSFTSA